jgi:hypothetical protein
MRDFLIQKVRHERKSSARECLYETFLPAGPGAGRALPLRRRECKEGSVSGYGQRLCKKKCTHTHELQNFITIHKTRMCKPSCVIPTPIRGVKTIFARASDAIVPREKGSPDRMRKQARALRRHIRPTGGRKLRIASCNIEMNTIAPLLRAVGVDI